MFSKKVGELRQSHHLLVVYFPKIRASINFFHDVFKRFAGAASMHSLR